MADLSSQKSMHRPSCGRKVSLRGRKEARADLRRIAAISVSTLTLQKRVIGGPCGDRVTKASCRRTRARARIAPTRAVVKGTTISEVVNDAGSYVTGLRHVMPEMFDAAALLSPVGEVVRAARNGVADGLSAVQKLAHQAGWSTTAVADLKANAHSTLDGLAETLKPDTAKLAVREVAVTDDARGPAWSRRTVTVAIANAEELVEAAAPFARGLERFHAFVHEAERERSEVERIEGKIHETRGHLARLEEELAELDGDGQSDHPADVAVRRERLGHQVDQTRDKLDHRRGQLDLHQRRLAEMVETFWLAADAPPEPALLGDLRRALAATRTETREVHDTEVESRLAHIARRRRSRRRTTVGVGLVVASAVAFAGIREERAARAAVEAELAPLKREILQHQLLRRSMTQAEVEAIQEATYRHELDEKYGAAVTRLRAEREDLDAILPTPNPNQGLVMVNAGEGVRLTRDTDDLVARARERLGAGTTVRVAFTGKELPVTVTTNELCAIGARIDYEVRVPLPLAETIVLSTGVVLDPGGFCEGRRAKYEPLDMGAIRAAQVLE